MPDTKFENEKLVAIYDAFDGERDDLIHYLQIAKNLRAKTVLDVGSGTGVLAHLLTKHKFDVTGLEPAKASIEYAKAKNKDEKIKWIHGFSADLPDVSFDIAFMTGNVAQVFLSDEDFDSNLKNIYRALNSNGHLVFEVRNPQKKAWQSWTKENTTSSISTEKFGPVTAWCEVIHVEKELVSFRWTYHFEKDHQQLTSDSTLRFRSKESIDSSLERCGFSINDVRDAPDRPGLELVYIAQKP